MVIEAGSRASYWKYANTFFTVFTACAAVAVLVDNVSLVTQIKRLQSKVSPRAAAPVSSVPLNSYIRAIGGLGIDGTFRLFSFPATDLRKILIVAMAPDCPGCRRNESQWIDLSRALADSPSWKVLWLSRGTVAETAEYANARAIRNILAEPLHQTFLEAALDKIPDMVAVNSDGRVERAWPGILNTGRWKEVYAYCGLDARTQGQN